MTTEEIMALAQSLGDLRVMAARGQCVTSDEVADAHKALQSAIEGLVRDAESWRAYKARKDAVIAAGMGRNPMRKGEQQ